MGIKIRLYMGFRKSVPWTYILADVAAKDPVFKFSFYRRGELFFEFDGKVGDASGSVHYAGLHDCVRRTCVDTTGTSAAIILHSRRVWICFQVNDQFGKKEKTALFAVEQEAVFTCPANTSFLGPLPFHYGCGVYKCPTAYFSAFSFQLFYKSL